MSNQEPKLQPKPQQTAPTAPLVVDSPDWDNAPDQVMEVASAAQAVEMIPLESIKADRNKMDPQVEALFSKLGSTDDPEALQKSVDEYMAAGRREIVEATRISNALANDQSLNLDGDSPAAKAILDMRQMFDELNPANQGNLMEKNKLFGIIPLPGMTKLQRYLRKYQSAQANLEALSKNMITAQAKVETDLASLKMNKKELWQAIEKMANAAYFAETLSEKVEAHLNELAQNDPRKADVLRSEVLYMLKQNVGDLRSAQAEALKSYMITKTLIKTGRDVKNACNRMNTLGMQALATAVMLARATKTQSDTMIMLKGAQETIESLSSSTADMLGQHVDMVIQFEQNPLFGIETLKANISKVTEAAQKFDNYRLSALDVMTRNNAHLKEFVEGEMSKIRDENNAGKTVADAMSTSRGALDL